MDYYKEFKSLRSWELARLRILVKRCLRANNVIGWRDNDSIGELLGLYWREVG